MSKISTDDLLTTIARRATYAESEVFARHFRSIVANESASAARNPVAYLGSRLDEYDDDNKTISRDHWLTWRTQGQPCVLVQLKPPNSRKRPISPETEPPAPPPLYLVTPSNKLYVIEEPVQSFRRFNTISKVFSFPLVVLEGDLVRRARVTSRHDTAFVEEMRVATLQTLFGGGGDILDSRTYDIVFLARDCLWSRVYRGMADAQQRMAQARNIIEGEPGNEPMLTSRRRRGEKTTTAGTYLHAIEYKLSMPSMHWRAIISDVPEVLRGVHLAGVEFRISSATHTPAPAPNADFYVTDVALVAPLIMQARGDSSSLSSS